jgi:hypothetical protein
MDSSEDAADRKPSQNEHEVSHPPKDFVFHHLWPLSWDTFLGNGAFAQILESFLYLQSPEHPR